MKKSLVWIMAISLTFFMLSGVVYASTTFGFGGKVEATKISGVTCTGNGTLVVLSSNAGGAVSAVSSVTSSKSSTGEKVTGAINGIYGMIPFYATDTSKKPKNGEWILGKADAVPDTKTCKIKLGKTSIPFPVRKTSKYGISK